MTQSPSMESSTIFYYFGNERKKKLVKRLIMVYYHFACFMEQIAKIAQASSKDFFLRHAFTRLFRRQGN